MHPNTVRRRLVAAKPSQLVRGARRRARWMHVFTRQLASRGAKNTATFDIRHVLKANVWSCEVAVFHS